MPGLFFLLPYPVSTTLHLGGHFPLSLWKRKRGKKTKKKKKRHINSSRGNHTYSLLGFDDRVWEFRKTSETSLQSSASTQERKKKKRRKRGRKKGHKVKTIEQTRPVVHPVQVFFFYWVHIWRLWSIGMLTSATFQLATSWQSKKNTSFMSSSTKYRPVFTTYCVLFSTTTNLFLATEPITDSTQVLGTASLSPISLKDNI